MNYAELTEAVIGYLEEIDEDSFIARMDDFVIQTEQQIYRAIKLPEIRVVQDGSISMVAGVNEILLPDPYLEIIDVAITQAQDDKDPLAPAPPGVLVKPLIRVDTSFIREAYPNRTLQGQPYHYAILNRQRIIVGPAPDFAYPVLYDYSTFPQSIVVAGNTWLGDNAEMCFLFGVLVNGYTFLKGEPDILAGYQSLYDRELGILRPEGDDTSSDQAVGTQ